MAAALQEATSCPEPNPTRSTITSPPWPRPPISPPPSTAAASRSVPPSPTPAPTPAATPGSSTGTCASGRSSPAQRPQ
jgi:hypothetical protein